MSFPKPKISKAPPPPRAGMDAPELLSLAGVDEDADLANRKAKGLGRLKVPLDMTAVSRRLALTGQQPGVQV